MSNVEEQVRETAAATDDWRHFGRTFLPPILFTIFYFVDIYLRATQKYFWFDELTTRDICRIPLGSLWDVLRHGADFNPPLFFLITKVSELALGETLIGLRAPEIIGFWILCLSLYRIVNVRAGWLAASVAMTLPITTGAFYYAYEARPHAIVLGFCGLAFVCWQLTLERAESRWWPAVFGSCLMAAFLLHCYAILIAVPFMVYEIVLFFRQRRLRWAMWIAMLAPCLVALVAYVPLLVSYRKYATGTDYPTLFPPSVGALTDFYVYVLTPCIFVVIVSCAVFAIECIRGPHVRHLDQQPGRCRELPELIVSSVFLALPILGVILGIVVRGPFFGRYFLSMVLGLCVLIGLGAGARGSRNWVAVVLAAVLCCPILWGAAALGWHRYHGRAEELREPSTGYQMNSSLRGPLDRYQLLLSHLSDSGPIAIVDPLDFSYLLHYAPDLRARLYYIQDAPNDFAYMGFQNYHAWAPFKFNRELTRPELLKLAPRFLVYGKVTFLKGIASLIQGGASVRAMRLENDHFLVDFQVNPTVLR